MASNIRAISTGYKVNTDKWGTVQDSNANAYALITIPSSIVGKNILYAFCIYCNQGSTPYPMWCYNGSWYINPGWPSERQLTFDSSTGYISGSNTHYWVYGALSLSYCFIVYT